MRFFFVSTNHLEDRIWFLDDSDFKVAMNYVAISSVTTGVSVIAFVLMSNHVHFLFEGSEESSIRFINHLKKLYGMYYRKKYSVKEFLRRNHIDIREIGLTNEALERCIAYIAMNPVAANICAFASDYRWGTGGAFFCHAPKGIDVSRLSSRKQQALLHSKTELRPGMIISEDGYIIPHSFVAVEFVESLYRSPSRMNYFLKNSSKSKKRLETDALPSFRDQSIIASAKDLCQSLFRKPSIDVLTDEEKTEFIKQLKRRFSADITQLARVSGLSTETVARMLDDFKVL